MKDYNGFSAAQRQRAYDWLKAQGMPVVDVCQTCGQTQGVLQPHSEDYSEPFGAHIGAFGLCYICHMMIHCRHHGRPRFNAYAQAVETGWRWAPAPRGRSAWEDFRRRFLEAQAMPAPLLGGELPQLILRNILLHP